LNLFIQINELITPEGQIYQVFQDLIDKFPNNLSDYSDFEIMKLAINSQNENQFEDKTLT